MHGTRVLATLILASLLLSSCSTLGSPNDRAADAAAADLAPTATQRLASPTVVRTASPTSAPARTPTASTKKPTPVVAMTAPSAATNAVLAGILPKVVATRDLQTKGKVPVGVLKRDQLGLYFAAMGGGDDSRRDVAKAKALLVLLGLVAAEDDLYYLSLGSLTDQVAGFYEFETHSMALVSAGGSLSLEEELTLAHEYVHALQDQHFDLGTKMRQAKDNGEQAAALRALSEGDATYAMLEYARQYKSAPQPAGKQAPTPTPIRSRSGVRSVPPVIEASLMFPYVQGTTFAASLFRSGGWAAVNKAYASPPQTTEQILHPDKYLAGDGPQTVTLPEIAEALGPEWSALDSDTIGEVGWLAYLAANAQASEAELGAAGWGGDRYILMQNVNGKSALAALTVWDKAQDAREFLQTILLGLRNIKRNVTVKDKGETYVNWLSQEGNNYVAIKGDQVLLVVAPDHATNRKILGRFEGY